MSDNPVAAGLNDAFKIDSWTIEKRCVRKDGTVIWVSVHGAALRDPAGKAARIIAMIEDITARKKNEREQPDTQKRLKKQLQESISGMLQVLHAPRTRAAGRMPPDRILRAVRESINRSIRTIGGKNSAKGSKPS